MKKRYKTLIVDDERLARQRLKKLLAGFSESFEIIGEAEDGFEAEDKIRLLKPEVVFLDIEMPGRTGFELLEKLDVIPLIVFCTAYEDYSLKAFETNSIDYLVKPVRIERLQQTVEKIERLKVNLASENIIKAIKEIAETKRVRKITSISIKKGDKIDFIKLDHICYFKASEKYVTVHTNKKEEMITQSLATLESKLPANFLRVQRGYIINTNYIKEFQKYFNWRYSIHMNNDQRTVIVSGRSYSESIKEWLKSN